MTAPTILGLTGSLITLVFLFELLRRRHLREKYAVLWISVAAVALLLTVVPGLLTGLSNLLGVDVPSNLVFFMALLLLLLATIQHSFEVGRLEEKTRTLAEEIALLRLDVEQGTQRHGSPE